ncbi:MAG: hypothetical protein Q4G69_00830 [Planctomycetia bacterium]|nr:hypothetical protein [Planctomycetia bacterium]
MNLKNVLARFRQNLLALGENYPEIVSENILMPNQFKEEVENRLLIELSIIVQTTAMHTETQRTIRLAVRHTVSVPMNSGTDRLYEICSAIAGSWSERLPERSGFSLPNGQNIYVRSIEQHQGEALQDACKASVDIIIDLYE